MEFLRFAFSVHTEIRLHCAGAKVNGRIAPLSRELKNGDTVEIMTDARQWPSQDWLAFVKTSQARRKIRQWIRGTDRPGLLSDVANAITGAEGFSSTAPQPSSGQ